MKKEIHSNEWIEHISQAASAPKNACNNVRSHESSEISILTHRSRNIGNNFRKWRSPYVLAIFLVCDHDFKIPTRKKNEMIFRLVAKWDTWNAILVNKIEIETKFDRNNSSDLPDCWRCGWSNHSVAW